MRTWTVNPLPPPPPLPLGVSPYRYACAGASGGPVDTSHWTPIAGTGNPTTVRMHEQEIAGFIHSSVNRRWLNVARHAPLSNNTLACLCCKPIMFFNSFRLWLINVPWLIRLISSVHPADSLPPVVFLARRLLFTVSVIAEIKTQPSGNRSFESAPRSV